MAEEIRHMFLFIEKVMLINGNWNCQAETKKKKSSGGTTRTFVQEIRKEISLMMTRRCRPRDGHQVVMTPDDQL